MNYEYDIHPTDPRVVIVRAKRRRPLGKRGRDQRPWKVYMPCDTARRAAEILAMLRREEVRP